MQTGIPNDQFTCQAIFDNSFIAIRSPQSTRIGTIGARARFPSVQVQARSRKVVRGDSAQVSLACRLRSSLKNSAPKERHNLAHGASRGSKAPSLSPVPSPARAGEGCPSAERDGVRGLRTQGWDKKSLSFAKLPPPQLAPPRPGLRYSAPNGARTQSGFHSETLSTNLRVRTLALGQTPTVAIGSTSDASSILTAGFTRN